MAKNKNQQFKIVVVVVLVICLISSIIAAVRLSTSSTPSPASKTEDGAAIKELEDLEDLETIKDSNNSRSIEKPVNKGGKKKYNVMAAKKEEKKSDIKTIPFFRNTDGSVKGITELTDEEYETLRKLYNRFSGPDEFKHTDYPNRLNHRHIRNNVRFLKEKLRIFSFLPGHEYSHNMNLSTGDRTFKERQEELIQKGVTDEQVLNWMDGWYRYYKKHKKIKIGGGEIINEDDYQDLFPYYTLSGSEIIDLAKDRKEQIDKDRITRINFLMYDFDDRTGQKVEGYRI